MTSSASDGHIDRLVKARWLAIGLSQSDLAEILDAAFEAPVKAKGATDNAGVDRLIDAAEALDIPADRLRERAACQGEAELKIAELPARCIPCSICACCGRFACCGISGPS
jgi:hypothetical protein